MDGGGRDPSYGGDIGFHVSVRMSHGLLERRSDDGDGKRMLVGAQCVDGRADGRALTRQCHAKHAMVPCLVDG